MEITDVRIRKIDSEGKMKAVVSVTFDNEFVVHDIKVIESQNGLFIAMPSRKAPDGEFRDIAHPINAETRGKIQSAILDKYEYITAAAELEENQKEEAEGTEEE
ncbi:septation regulator SpoVG [Acetivibrio saccincola]|jgi:stage V sporulation protein G|uniref:Putative septation protein SpoVG n=1 Tax=Acetivibrio saccincola TaxID=1677857 RepID=A0A2K9E3Q4_9FIRM|nr:septation regulator SpoVG [Acetivibrio saccincola]AUG56086.1 Putative septation protein SpoVG [Acetivibrio saccincola]NLW28146.1 septation regulator SpoVG [Acetivibrio saccincola]PQQ65728.1 septation protein SpoVG [Acetivibrio saccincola]HOA96565.1 septation regulator SpoVG [Acetivibrio saccincola]HQD27757.1 septation regulator SpoVG [Acetivibrio saccincola]